MSTRFWMVAYGSAALGVVAILVTTYLAITAHPWMWALVALNIYNMEKIADSIRQGRRLDR